MFFKGHISEDYEQVLSTKLFQTFFPLTVAINTHREYVYFLNFFYLHVIHVSVLYETSSIVDLGANKIIYDD